MSNTTHQFHHKPDLPDTRDIPFNPETRALKRKGQPGAEDLRRISGGFPPVYNQGRLNSCSANALAALLYFDEVKQKRPQVSPSRLFIYYNTRKMEGTLNDPSYGKAGAPVSIRDAIKSANAQGYCDEKQWPYEESKLDVSPPKEAYQGATHHHAYRYHRITQDLAHMQSCLSNGFPFIFGFKVYAGFLAPSTWQTGIIPMPSQDQTSLGGHAMAAVGYDDKRQWFIIRNSLGENFGEGGYGYFPYDDALNTDDAFDFWVVSKVLDR